MNPGSAESLYRLLFGFASSFPGLDDRVLAVANALLRLNDEEAASTIDGVKLKFGEHYLAAIITRLNAAIASRRLTEETPLHLAVIALLDEGARLNADAGEPARVPDATRASVDELIVRLNEMAAENANLSVFRHCVNTLMSTDSSKLCIIRMINAMKSTERLPQTLSDSIDDVADSTRQSTGLEIVDYAERFILRTKSDDILHARYARTCIEMMYQLALNAMPTMAMKVRRSCSFVGEIIFPELDTVQAPMDVALAWYHLGVALSAHLGTRSEFAVSDILSLVGVPGFPLGFIANLREEARVFLATPGPFDSVDVVMEMLFVTKARQYINTHTARDNGYLMSMIYRLVRDAPKDVLSPRQMSMFWNAAEIFESMIPNEMGSHYDFSDELKHEINTDNVMLAAQWFQTFCKSTRVYNVNAAHVFPDQFIWTARLAAIRPNVVRDILYAVAQCLDPQRVVDALHIGIMPVSQILVLTDPVHISLRDIFVDKIAHLLFHRVDTDAEGTLLVPYYFRMCIDIQRHLDLFVYHTQNRLIVSSVRVTLSLAQYCCERIKSAPGNGLRPDQIKAVKIIESTVQMTAAVTDTPVSASRFNLLPADASARPGGSDNLV